VGLSAAWLKPVQPHRRHVQPFVFFELMSAAAFALCGYKTEDPGALQGALNFAVTNTIGAYFVLSGIGLLSARAL
jgi:multicomponent Na+:H+ antiporter subunit D